jgi:hypothetical protein
VVVELACEPVQGNFRTAARGHVSHLTVGVEFLRIDHEEACLGSFPSLFFTVLISIIKDFVTGSI